jgi:UDPglucose 6-dehydrogenase
MKIAVTGNDSLAQAASICCRRHFDLLATPSPSADVLWVCHDTPIGPDNRPDVDFVVARIREELAKIDPTVLVLVSSQIPVGTTWKLEKEFPQFTFAHSPENIRVANAVADFENQSRVVVGMRSISDVDRRLLTRLFDPFTDNLIFTDPETAEMAKTALNCYLAMSIAYINEIARVCAAVGADANVVSMALRTDARVSPKAPLRPGAPFGGGHLERELFTVNEVARACGLSVPILEHIAESNAIVAT